MRVFLLAFLVVLLSACDGPIDFVDPYDRIQGEPSGQVQTFLDVPANEPEPDTVAVGNAADGESGGAGGDHNEAAGGAETGH